VTNEHKVAKTTDHHTSSADFANHQ